MKQKLQKKDIVRTTACKSRYSKVETNSLARGQIAVISQQQKHESCVLWKVL